MNSLLRFIVRQLALLTVRQHHMEERMSEVLSNQQHLDQDVSALGQAFSEAVEELKAKAATGDPLDFSKLDALVTSTQAEAAADAPGTSLTGSGASSAPGSAPADPPADTSGDTPPVVEPDPASGDAATVPAADTPAS